MKAVLFSLKHRSQTHLWESTRGGGGHALHSELGFTISDENQMQMASQNNGPEHARHNQGIYIHYHISYSPIIQRGRQILSCQF